MGLRPSRDSMPLASINAAASFVHLYERAPPPAQANYMIVLVLYTALCFVSLYHFEHDQRRRWIWAKLTSNSL